MKVSPSPITEHGANKYSPKMLLDEGRCAVAVSHPRPCNRANPEALDPKSALHKFLGAAVPTKRLVALLDFVGRVVLSHDSERCLQAAPTTLDGEHWSSHVRFVALRLQVSVSLLYSQRGTMIKHTEEEPAENHMKENYRENERAMVLLRTVRHVEQFIAD
jgi:hypothetical protein